MSHPIYENCSRTISFGRCLSRALVGLAASLLWAGSGYALEPDIEIAMRQLNQQFSDEVIIPGYAALDSQMANLVQATQLFEADPTEINLTAARKAWLESVSRWTSSNAVAFGPVHSLGYSAALESPVDEAGIDALLANADETAAVDVASLLPSLQGFEAMAYLLDIEGNKTAADFSRQERRYLSALAVRADAVTANILTVWQAGWNSNPAYRTLLSTAGSPENDTYLSVQAGSEEIIRSIINSLEVVSAEELPDILAASVSSAESPDAITLKLLTSSLEGIQSAYLGAADGESARRYSAGVSELVAIAHPDVDQQIKASLVTALDNIEQTMANPTDITSLSQAQRSLEIAFELLDTKVLPLVQN